MAYAYSEIDKKLSKWFLNDFSHGQLRDLELRSGQIRSLREFEIEFTYPIAAVAGRNGSGKSTLLALAACAFHSIEQHIPLANRKYPYFRFSDFFVQSPGESPVEDVRIIYGIAHDAWKPTSEDPEKRRIGYQHRVKQKGGKWNDYDLRIRRPVVFLGIDRVVPHSEKSISKSYRQNFQSIDRAGWEDEVRARVSKVLGTSYDDFEFSRYTKYRLPKVKRNGNTYSGFNMGAGENALFEMLAMLLSSPKGTLVIVDEIELGLHEEAQVRFIRELKELCLERQLQVICTTHSGAILRALPPEGRFFLESYPARTIVTKGMSPAYATGRLSGENSRELDVFVEDEIACALLTAAVDKNIRSRVSIMPIGSASALVNQLAARKREIKPGAAVAVMDGDQKPLLAGYAKTFLDHLGNVTGADAKDAAATWFKNRVGFLPGTNWPELWLLQTAQAHCLAPLAKLLSTTEDDLSAAIEQGILAGKHKELHAMATYLHIDVDELLIHLAQSVVSRRSAEFGAVRKLIRTYLE